MDRKLQVLGQVRKTKDVQAGLAAKVEKPPHGRLAFK